jgi:hypothetical protein
MVAEMKFWLLLHVAESCMIWGLGLCCGLAWRERKFAKISLDRACSVSLKKEGFFFCAKAGLETNWVRSSWLFQDPSQARVKGNQILKILPPQATYVA